MYHKYIAIDASTKHKNINKLKLHRTTSCLIFTIGICMAMLGDLSAPDRSLIPLFITAIGGLWLALTIVELEA